MYIIMRKKGCYGKSTYRYVVQEYDTWEHAKLVSKRYFKTQREIQSAYDISRSCIYHTMHHNLERIKKYLSCDWKAIASDSRKWDMRLYPCNSAIMRLVRAAKVSFHTAPKCCILRKLITEHVVRRQCTARSSAAPPLASYTTAKQPIGYFSFSKGAWSEKGKVRLQKAHTTTQAAASVMRTTTHSRAV